MPLVEARLFLKEAWIPERMGRFSEAVRAVRKQVVVMKFKEMYEGKSQNLTETFRKAYKGAQEVCEVHHCTVDGVEWLWPADAVL